MKDKCSISDFGFIIVAARSADDAISSIASSINHASELIIALHFFSCHHIVSSESEALTFSRV